LREVAVTSPAPPGAPAPPLPAQLEVAEGTVWLVRWPDDAALRAALAALGRPRVLVVDPAAVPPPDLDPEDEDWLRSPPDAAELVLRARQVGRRSRRGEDPPASLDDDGVLRRGPRWVAISEAQAPVLRLLLDQAGRLVRFEDLVAVHAAHGGSDHPASIRTIVSRLGERIGPLGLSITSVRRRGFVLHPNPPALGRGAPEASR
jgi:hypothetical protein